MRTSEPKSHEINKLLVAQAEIRRARWIRRRRSGQLHPHRVRDDAIDGQGSHLGPGDSFHGRDQPQEPFPLGTVHPQFALGPAKMIAYLLGYFRSTPTGGFETDKAIAPHCGVLLLLPYLAFDKAKSTFQQVEYHGRSTPLTCTGCCQNWL